MITGSLSTGGILFNHSTSIICTVKLVVIAMCLRRYFVIDIERTDFSNSKPASGLDIGE
tara:strand:+ start:940 stop:1116 length:177 start_codon:yes stop_codon:yes gene_type:complete